MHELISLVFNHPHLVLASRLDALAGVLLNRGGYDLAIPEQPTPQAFAVSDSAIRAEGGYWLDDGVAIVDVLGTLVHRASGLDAASGLTGYNQVGRRFERALNDPKVNAILLNMDSPGGSVNGAFDLADKIHSARGVKPVHALAGDVMASACYLIASGAERIYTTQTGMVGSIGVVMKHLDMSEMNAKRGVSPTYIYAGDRKIDGNSDAPLSKEALARFDSEIKKLYGMFTSVVADRRKMALQAVIDTQAGVFLGQDAVDIGLADEVTTGERLLESLKAEFGAVKPRFGLTATETPSMSTEHDQPQPTAANPTGEPATVAAAEVDTAAVATEARTEERARCAAILNSDAAAGRYEAAVALATETDMVAEAAIATLGKMPKVAAAAPSRLDRVMAGEDQPEIGADGGEGGEVTTAQTLLHNFNAATGRKQRV